MRAEVFSSLGATTPFALVLSGFDRVAGCDSAAPSTAVVGSFRCHGSGLTQQRLVKLAEVANRLRSETEVSADRLWAEASLDLVSAPDDPASVDRAISRLKEVARLAPGDPFVMNDLAVATAVHSAQLDDPTYLFEALDWIERASAIDTVSGVVTHNRAVIRSRVGLGAPPTTPPGAPKAEPPESPEELRRRFLRDLLAGFVVDRDAESGAALRRVAEEYRVATGDSELTLLAAWAVEDVTPERRAAGIGAFAEGLVAFEAGTFGTALDALERATRLLGGPGCVLCPWIVVYRGHIAAHTGNHQRAFADLTPVVELARRERRSALGAQASWGLALSAARSGRLRQARAHYQAAGDAFGAIHEVKNAGTMEAQLAEVYRLTGQDLLASRSSYRALLAITEPPRGRFHSEVLGSTSHQLRDHGLIWAAVAFGKAEVGATASGRKDRVARALIGLADAEAAAGLKDSSRRHFSLAASELEGAPDDFHREEMAALLARGLTRIGPPSIPEIARLDSTIDYFERRGTVILSAPLLLEKARLLLRAVDTSAALQTLHRGADEIGESVDAQVGQSKRSLFETKATAYRLLSRIALARADTVGAFWLDERGRGMTSADSLLIAGWRPRPGDRVAKYTQHDVDLAIWTVDERGIRVAIAPLPPEQVEELADRFGNLVRHGRLLPTFDQVARDVFSSLIAPVVAGGVLPTELRLVATGAIGQMPLAAAIDPRTGEYLVERLAVSFSARTTGALWRDSPVGAIGDGVVLIGDPQFDRSAFPELAPLPAALWEVEQIAGLYPGATVLSAQGATIRAVRRALPGARIVHFAGHARWVPNSEALSHVVLAPDSSAEDRGALYGTDLAELELGAAKLVVLSACGPTSRSGSAGNALAAAFLAAGAGGVVSGGWEADDRRTAELMVTLHRELAVGRPPADALRRAQEWLLDEYPTAPPGTWAQFRLETR